jgi:hypothetical protein
VGALFCLFPLSILVIARHTKPLAAPADESFPIAFNLPLSTWLASLNNPLIVLRLGRARARLRILSEPWYDDLHSVADVKEGMKVLGMSAPNLQMSLR